MTFSNGMSINEDVLEISAMYQHSKYTKLENVEEDKQSDVTTSGLSVGDTMKKTEDQQQWRTFVFGLFDDETRRERRVYFGDTAATASHL